MEQEEQNKEEKTQKTLHIADMYENWFLDYASYVILDRAVPEVIDGLKPVQRRILHSMYELDDGRYNKVANIVGNTMKYHPHGDAAIGNAIVQLGQKELLIDTQGNWGNILTGDGAAAPRYIEARLTPFAKEVVFNPKTTEWTPSYDGRNKEPVTLPVKFPLLLAQGAKGIAVGLACDIMPHNFNELINASIAYLKKEDFVLYPDFPTGGKIDVSKYNDGKRGGKLKIRAKISKLDNRTLVISEIPWGTTTDKLIDSIVDANNKGKIKIKKIDDNTASNVEIIIQLASGVSPDKTIDGLYAFTECQSTISPNTCVIHNEKPEIIGVSDILKISTDNTVELLYKEQLIRKAELLEQILYMSLERIFIENRIYRKIEECKTWESVLSTIDKGLEPFKSSFYREITTDDIIKLTEIKIKKISKYDLNREEEKARGLENELKQVEANMNDIVGYAIKYFLHIQEKYGKGKERKTEIVSLDDIDAIKAVAQSSKLYINRAEGFAGTALKKDEYVCDCSDIDQILTIHKSGKYEIRKVSDKFFVGNDVKYINVFRKNDDRTIYNVVYQDGRGGAYYVKRFPISGIVLDKEYDITNGKPDSKIIYLNVRPNGEAETIKVFLRPRPKMKNQSIEYDFSKLTIKGRNSKGNLLTKNPINRITLKDEGVSTLAARKIWYDETVRRLNTEGRGTLLGAFEADDKIFYATPDGNCHVINFDLSNHFENDPVVICKHYTDRIYSVIYYAGDKGQYYVKRFQLDNNEFFGTMLDKDPGSKLVNIFIEDHPRIALAYPDKNDIPTYYEMVELDSFIDSKGITAKGKRLTTKSFDEILILQPYYPDKEYNAEEAKEESQNKGENQEQNQGKETSQPSESQSNENQDNNKTQSDTTVIAENEEDNGGDVITNNVESDGQTSLF